MVSEGDSAPIALRGSRLCWKGPGPPPPPDPIDAGEVKASTSGEAELGRRRGRRRLSIDMAAGPGGLRNRWSSTWTGGGQVRAAAP
jgi:hypothetical protein